MKVDKGIEESCEVQVDEFVGGNIRSLQNPSHTSVTENKPKECVAVDW